LLNDVWLFLRLQHKDAYQVILDGVKGGPKEKRLAAQFIPKFFSSFPELADAAINAQLDLCEDEDVSVSASKLCTLCVNPIFRSAEEAIFTSFKCLREADLMLPNSPDNHGTTCCFQIRRQAIKELPRFATGENILRVADILTQLLQTGTGML